MVAPLMVAPTQFLVVMALTANEQEQKQFLGSLKITFSSVFEVILEADFKRTNFLHQFTMEVGLTIFDRAPSQLDRVQNGDEFLGSQDLIQYRRFQFSSA